MIKTVWTVAHKQWGLLGIVDKKENIPLFLIKKGYVSDITEIYIPLTTSKCCVFQLLKKDWQHQIYNLPLHSFSYEFCWREITYFYKEDE